MAKLLLVEDDNNLREIYEARLSAEGYEITTAQNGEEALSIAKQSHPDLIISDVMMPRISGFEMLDILRNTDELKTTKVIMLTALGQSDDRGRADNLGADKYLVKSQVTLEDIVNATKALLEGSSETTVEPEASAETPINLPEPIMTETEPTDTTTMEPVVAPQLSQIIQPETTNTETLPPLDSFNPNTFTDPATDDATIPITPPSVEIADASNIPSSDPMSFSTTSIEPTTNSDDAFSATPLATTAQTVQVADDPQATTVAVTDPDPLTPRISPVAQPLSSDDDTATPPIEPTTTPVNEPPVASVAPIIEPVTENELPNPASNVAEDITDPNFDLPENPTYSSEPESAQQPEITPQPLATAGAQSLADEEAAIEAQIAAFAEKPENPNTEGPALSAIIDTPEHEQTPPQIANDALLSDAIAKLIAPNENDTKPERTTLASHDPSGPIIISPRQSVESPSESTPPTEPSPAENEPSAQIHASESATTQNPVDSKETVMQQSVSGHKTIQPLNYPEQITPKLDELLALEEAKEAADTPPTPMVGTADTPAQPANGQNFDPNTIAL